MTSALQCCCDFPGCPFPGIFRRQTTAYEEERDNWAWYCWWHQQETDKYWEECWDDYYRGLL